MDTFIIRKVKDRITDKLTYSWDFRSKNRVVYKNHLGHNSRQIRAVNQIRYHILFKSSVLLFSGLPRQFLRRLFKDAAPPEKT